MSEGFNRIDHTDERFDALMGWLPPQVLEIGQLVWWNETPGGIIQGRVRRIELGFYSTFKPENAARRYVAEPESRTQQDYRQHTMGWRPFKNHADWKSGMGFVNEPDYLYPLCSTFEKARDRAIKDMLRWAEEAERDAKNRRAVADFMATMNVPTAEEIAK